MKILNKIESFLNSIEKSVTETLSNGFNLVFGKIEELVMGTYKKLKGDTLMISRDSVTRMNRLKIRLEKFTSKLGSFFTRPFKKIFNSVNKSGVQTGKQLIRESDKSIKIVSDGILKPETNELQASSLNNILHGLFQNLNQNITALVGQGVGQNWSQKQLSESMRNQLKIQKTRAETVSKTNVMSAFNNSVQAVYVKSGITHVRLFATNDERTCPTCVYRNMNVYKIGTIMTPLHFRCRCLLLPYNPTQKDLEWEKKHYDSMKSGFKGKLNKGVSSNEKNAGLTSPPDPFFTFN